MQTKTKIHSFLITLMLALVAPLQAAEVFPLGSTWSYFIGTQEASSPTNAWRALAFDDSTWLSGPGAIGYPSTTPPGAGDLFELTIQTTLPTSTVSNYLSVFFRRKFDIASAPDISQATLTMRVDDGYVVWVNGTEVGRDGVPDGELPFNTSVAATTENVERFVSIPPSALVSGQNIIAVQVFQAGTTSSDLVMDVALNTTVDNAPPVIVATDPVQGSSVSALTFIGVVFDESVTGINASDLLINGSPATSITTNSPREYQFNFPAPATGAVNVAFIAGHGITDLASTPHPFAGGSWSYTLNPNAFAGAVVISEFLADNTVGVSDEDGTRSDWIELYNPGLVEVGLDGWYLTDTTNSPTQWRIPNVILGAGKYLRIWASQKNRINPAAPLHTNFKLSKSAGSYLALSDPAGNVISAFSGASYPVQFSDISFGRDRVDPNIIGYFTVPTPGAQNSTSGSGFATAPTLSLESGVYTNASLNLVITVPLNTTVRYTTDGTAPTNTSTVYTTPINLANNTTLKVRAFPNSGSLFPSEVLARNFVFLDATTKDFNSNLPILIMSTDGRAMASSAAAGFPRTKGTFAVFDTYRGRSAFSRKPDFIGPAEFEIFGQTSAGFPKQPYNIEIQDALGNDNKVSILGLPAEADWKLRNPYSDKCLMNDFLAYELFEQMGHYSVRRKFVEVFLDTGIGRLSYPGDYVGVEVFLEKIERGNDRVDIAELTPAHTNQPSITGGYMFKKDKDSGGDINFTAGGQALKLHEPKPKEMRPALTTAMTTWPGAGYTPSASNQLSYLVNYINAFNTALTATDWLTRTGTNHYSNYIDLDAFVDQHWIVEFPKQIDGYRLSDYFQKDRNGKIKPAPIWDWNLAFGNADYLDGGNTSKWYYAVLNDANAHIWLSRMIGNQPIPNTTLGDPDFIQKIADRWSVLRTNVMNGERVTNRIDEIARLLNDNSAPESAVTRNYAKYANILNTYLWPNPQGPPANDVDYTQPTYDLIISEMKKWTYGRYVWIDNQFPKSPAFNLDGGDVPAGFNLFITAPAGNIYYTLDGTDPRQSGGNPSPSALPYSTPIAINSNARVFARARVGTTWSGPRVATFVVQRPGLVITEIMYHPAPPIPGPGVTNIDEDFEYIEVKNIGATSLNVSNFTLSGGVDFTFPNLTLAAGQRALVVKNQAAFISRYGNSLTIAGQYTGNLANEGNRLILQGRLREPLLDFSYDDAWYPVTDGFGFSLVVVNESAAPAAWDTAAQWRPSGVVNGTPGQGDGGAPTIAQVVINEALTHSDPAPPTDTIELRNLSSGPASVAGWFLTDDFRNPKKFRIPLNTPDIAAGGYLTFDESAFNVAALNNIPFSLSSSGDEVYLFSADASGNLTGYYHGFSYGAAKSGVTFGRYVTSQGQEHFVSQSSATLGTANSAVLVGPVVVSEIMYRPSDVLANGAYWNNTEDEYIELANITGSPVGLFDAARPTNTWKLDKAVEFSFPANITIPANSYLIVANFNPATDPAQLAAFRSKYGVPGGIQILGPYKGSLDNSDENVSLYQPDAPETVGPDAGKVPYVLVDAVRYDDKAPWPTAADGTGHALHRVNPAAYGNDPINWAAAGPTPGSAFISGSAPVISANPSNVSVPATANASFSGGAIGVGPITYRWLFNGAVVPGATSSTLNLTSVQVAQAGQYQLMALNPFGSAVSAPATLTVLIPVNISQQPVTQRVVEGANVSLSVLASSANPPITYQWMFNGLPIPGANSFFYSITGATDTHDGTYSVALTDGNGTVMSANAQLTVLIPATLLSPVPGLNLTAVAGETIVLGAQFRGTKPLWVQWRKTSTAGGNQGLVRTNFLNVNQDFFVTNATALSAGTYSLQYTNIVGGSGLGSGTQRTNAILTVLADSNGNGIPDQWESTYFGSPTGADRDADSDGDGMSNWAEYIAGTNPTNAASYLKTQQISAAAGANVIFQAAPGKTYTVEYKDGLNAAVWTKLSDVIARSTDWTATVNDPRPGTNRYYRLLTPRRQ